MIDRSRMRSVEVESYVSLSTHPSMNASCPVVWLINALVFKIPNLAKQFIGERLTMESSLAAILN